jgi:hypothetical protein
MTYIYDDSLIPIEGYWIFLDAADWLSWGKGTSSEVFGHWQDVKWVPQWQAPVLLLDWMQRAMRSFIRVVTGFQVQANFTGFNVSNFRMLAAGN